jgi:hypothetical protein
MYYVYILLDFLKRIVQIDTIMRLTEIRILLTCFIKQRIILV